MMTIKYLLVMLLVLVSFSFAQEDAAATDEASTMLTLLTDPFLQLPTEDSVRVVWFTEFEGSNHTVTFGDDLTQTVTAETIKLSRMFEDGQSRVGEQVENNQVYNRVTPRDIWRHEALVGDLAEGERVPYFVTSVADDGTEIQSAEFTLAPLPRPGDDLRILLTSDHQSMPMTPANLQKVEETIGRVDAVFFAGDLVNIPDRASEWFDDNRERAFFPSLQGKVANVLERSLERNNVTFNTTTQYRGGEIIQHAPLFPAVGNHEVMGRFNMGNPLGYQYNDPRPREVAERTYDQYAELVNPANDDEVRDAWIRDNSFNTVTYEELFTLPDSGPSGEQYYAIQFGDVYLISLYATRIWRTPSLGDDARGKYREALRHLNIPDEWGWGEFIFEPIRAGSEQYEWLREQLTSEAFQNARYKVVMMHHPVRGVGDNSNPIFTDPVQIIDRDEDGQITAVRYEYPIEDDHYINDIEPLLEAAGVQLVHFGHSHVWFRFQTEAGMNLLETSNVGNSYGCYLEGFRERNNWPNDPRYDADNYVIVGDPHGAEPIVPSEFAPMSDAEGNPLPCVTSNEMTVFSILDTATGRVDSYIFDTRDPEGDVLLFDSFSLLGD
jgi:hypothetical protein